MIVQKIKMNKSHFIVLDRCKSEFNPCLRSKKKKKKNMNLMNFESHEPTLVRNVKHFFSLQLILVGFYVNISQLTIPKEKEK